MEESQLVLFATWEAWTLGPRWQGAVRPREQLLWGQCFPVGLSLRLHSPFVNPSHLPKHQGNSCGWGSPPSTHTCRRFGGTGPFDFTVGGQGIPNPGRQSSHYPLFGRGDAACPFSINLRSHSELLRWFYPVITPSFPSPSPPPPTLE